LSLSLQHVLLTKSGCRALHPCVRKPWLIAKPVRHILEI
jgi:hypothetical protein